jgi:hypothetical protein
MYSMRSCSALAGSTSSPPLLWTTKTLDQEETSCTCVLHVITIFPLLLVITTIIPFCSDLPPLCHG